MLMQPAFTCPIISSLHAPLSPPQSCPLMFSICGFLPWNSFCWCFWMQEMTPSGHLNGWVNLPYHFTRWARDILCLKAASSWFNVYPPVDTVVVKVKTPWFHSSRSSLMVFWLELHTILFNQQMALKKVAIRCATQTSTPFVILKGVLPEEYTCYKCFIFFVFFFNIVLQADICK